MLLIKICGVTDPQDAADAAHLGADWIGFHLSHKSKRCVTVSQAREIVQSCRESKVNPVAVFSDEDGDEILDLCAKTGIDTIELRGKQSRQYMHLLLPFFEIVFSLRVTSKGTLFKEDMSVIQPSGRERKVLPPWMLFDHLEGGPYSRCWRDFLPQFPGPWMLGGDITIENVESAILCLHPYGINVCGSIEKSASVRKDKALMEQLINNAREGFRLLKSSSIFYEALLQGKHFLSLR